MLLALLGKNKLGFIKGTIKRPDESQVTLLSAWQCNNDIITSWIINSVSKKIAASLINTGCVRDVWDQLKKRYLRTNGPRIFQLRKDLVTTTQGTSSVEVNFAKITSIWQELSEFMPLDKCTCQGLKCLIDHLESEFVMVFLMGLNESFAQMRAQVLLMNPLPPID